MTTRLMDGSDFVLPWRFNSGTLNQTLEPTPDLIPQVRLFSALVASKLAADRSLFAPSANLHLSDFMIRSIGIILTKNLFKLFKRGSDVLLPCVTFSLTPINRMWNTSENDI